MKPVFQMWGTFEEPIVFMLTSSELFEVKRIHEHETASVLVTEPRALIFVGWFLSTTLLIATVSFSTLRS